MGFDTDAETIIAQAHLGDRTRLDRRPRGGWHGDTRRTGRLSLRLFASNVDFANSTPEAAAVRFDTALARFDGDQPLIQLTRQDGRVRVEVNRRERPSGAKPELLDTASLSDP
jgi:hypothetical protein